jgi:hypothetical protein
MLTLNEYLALPATKPKSWYKGEEIESAHAAYGAAFGWIKLKDQPTEVLITGAKEVISLEEPVIDGFPESRERVVELLIEARSENERLRRELADKDLNVSLSDGEYAELTRKAYIFDQYMAFHTSLMRYRNGVPLVPSI